MLSIGLRRLFLTTASASCDTHASVADRSCGHATSLLCWYLYTNYGPFRPLSVVETILCSEWLPYSLKLSVADAQPLFCLLRLYTPRNEDMLFYIIIA
ncbi:hypothetical protein BDZ97DRAFT_363231 [Flammula alnicola]|nr:hypothetical protein BDZ97DRAFT_363231 [Flammula alnicola]